MDRKFWKNILTFSAITLFYFFESGQMGYFAALAPQLLHANIYNSNQIANLSSAYYYGDVIGLLPAGFLLDRFPLRKVLLLAIFGSAIGAVLLLAGKTITAQWIARFICGVFGGTFSFLGGIRVVSRVFPEKFSFYFGIFLAAGMFGGLLCLSPLLYAVHHIGIEGAIMIMALFSFVVILFNLLFLRPTTTEEVNTDEDAAKPILANLISIFKNLKNYPNVLLVVLLDTPISILGTLWGIVILMNSHHFSDYTSAYILMSLFLGLIIGLPVIGKLADFYSNPVWLVKLGCLGSLLSLLGIFFIHNNALIIAALFFTLGFFSSVQGMVFTWLTQNMKPELIGLNSAINSMFFMGANGYLKQISGSIMLAAPIFLARNPASNVFLLMIFAFILAMVLITLIKLTKSKLFKKNVSI